MLSVRCSAKHYPPRIYTDKNYSGDIESLLQDQATVIFEGASKILAAYPPTPNPGIERKLALYYLDALLHDTRLGPKAPPL